MAHEFKIKNGLIINDTQAVTGITDTTITSNSSNLVTEAQIFTEIGGLSSTYVNLSGDTMTGQLDTPALSATTISATSLTSSNLINSDNIPLVSDSNGTIQTGETTQLSALTIFDTRYVNLTGDTVTGPFYVQDNVTITGNLVVSGGTFSSFTENVFVKDNIMILNDGETGSTVTSGYAGLKIDRGSGDPYWMVFSERNESFRVGSSASGETAWSLSADTQSVATREDSPTASGVTYWNDSLNRLDTTTGLTISDGGDLDLAANRLITFNNSNFIKDNGGSILQLYANNSLSLHLNNNNSYFYSNLYTENLYPRTTLTYDIGSASYMWNKLFLNTGSTYGIHDANHQIMYFSGDTGSTSIFVNTLTGTTGVTRMVEADSNGRLFATSQIIGQYITDFDVINNITTGSNWTGDTYGGSYSGMSIGDKYIGADYYYEYDGGVIIRLPYSTAAKAIQEKPVTTFTADTTIDSTMHYIFVDGSTTGITATLPAASDYSGVDFKIKFINTDNACYIAPSGADTFEFLTGSTQFNKPDSVVTVSDGVSSWYVI